MARPKLGILVGPRGRGSNMQAIARACLDGRIAADVATVIAPKRNNIEGTLKLRT